MERKPYDKNNSPSTTPDKDMTTVFEKLQGNVHKNTIHKSPKTLCQSNIQLPGYELNVLGQIASVIKIANIGLICLIASLKH